MPTTGPKTLKHERPACGITGFPTAYDLLDKVDNEAQRLALCELVRRLGVQGAPAMHYAASQALWWTGLRTDPPVPKAALKSRDRDHIERRVLDELATYDRTLFPYMRKRSKNVVLEPNSPVSIRA